MHFFKYRCEFAKAAKKLVHFVRIQFLRLRSFLMIPLTTLYNKYIDRQQLTEKPSCAYSPPPTKVEY